MTPSSFGLTPISSTEIDLHWTNGTDPQTGVSIERCIDDVNFVEIIRLGASAITYKDQTLLPSTTYYYRIRAFNGITPSPYTAVLATSTKTPAWVQLSTGATAPTVRINVGATFAESAGSMIVCQGDDGNPVNTETWALNNSGSGVPSWTQIGTGVNPGTRTSPGVAYSSSSQVYAGASNAVILFGGLDQSGPSPVFRNDVLTMDPTNPTNWAPVVTAGTPPSGRVGHAVAFAGSRLYVIGGQNSNPYPNNLMNDAWALDFSSPTPFWVQLSSGPFAPRNSHTAIYDSANNQIVIFGGSDGTNPRNDTWALHLGTSPYWSQLLPSGSPPSPRSFSTAVYHSKAEFMIVFGGNTLTGSVNDTWILSLSGTPTWSPLLVTGTLPGIRGQHGAAFNDVDNRMNMFGGWDVTLGTLYPEAWKLQF